MNRYDAWLDFLSKQGKPDGPLPQYLERLKTEAPCAKFFSIIWFQKITEALANFYAQDRPANSVNRDSLYAALQISFLVPTVCRVGVDSETGFLYFQDFRYGVQRRILFEGTTLQWVVSGHGTSFFKFLGRIEQYSAHDLPNILYHTGLNNFLCGGFYDGGFYAGGM